MKFVQGIYKNRVTILFLILVIGSTVTCVGLRINSINKSKACLEELASQYKVPANYIDVGKVIEKNLQNQLKIGMTGDEVNKILEQFSPVYHGVKGNLSDGKAEIVTMQFCAPPGNGFSFLISYSSHDSFRSLTLYIDD